MNFETLKIGFKLYLEGLEGISNKEYITDNSEISIFMYSDEFKNYLSDELNCDASIFSKSINDILEMEIVNGQLVDKKNTPDSDLNSDSFEAESDYSTEGDTGIVADNAETGVITDENLINSDVEANSVGETQAEPDLIQSILNDLLKDDKFISYLDTDQNNEINEEEFTDFLNTIKGYDNNENTISLEDIITAAGEIQDGTFKITTPETILEDIQNESISIPSALSGNFVTSGSSGGVIPSSGNSGVSGSSGSSGIYSPQGVKEKTLDNMSKEELNSELSSAQSDLSDKQSALSAILDGSDPQIQKLQQNIDDAYDIYQEELKKVDEDMAAQVDILKQNIDAKEAEIDAKEQEISDQEGVVADSETAYNNAVSTRETLENSLYVLKAVDTTEMTPEKKSELNSQIAELEGKIADAKQAENDAKQTRDEAQDKLDTLNEEKEELISGEGGLNELNEKMTELEAQIADKYPAIQEYMDAYNNAKEEYNTAKESAITSAKADVTEAQNYVNEVQTAINNYDNRETARDYCFDGLTEITRTAIELAFSQLGIYEDAGDNRGTMEKYGAGAGVPWCAAFVSWLFGEGQGVNSNNPLDFTASVSNLRDQAQEAGYYSEVGSYMPVPGDIMIQKSNGASHTGIVVAVDGNTIYTIEGNSGDAVRLREYEIGGSSYQKISGWIRMNEWTGGSGDIPTDTYLAYANGSENADEITRSTR